MREPAAGGRVQDSRRVQYGVAADPDERRRGVITYSSGNHGQAMALAARELGAPAVVVMPKNASRIKVEGARSFGAEVIFEGTTSVERRERAEREALARGLTMVPPVRSSLDHCRSGDRGARDPLSAS